MTAARRTVALSDERLWFGGMAAYWTATGIWPFVSRPVFEAVTGKKQDFWLVHTVGALVASMGIGLAAGLRTGEPSREMQLATVIAGLGLAGVEAVYVARRRISPVYAIDAVVEATWSLWAARRLLRSAAAGVSPLPGPGTSSIPLLEGDTMGEQQQQRDPEQQEGQRDQQGEEQRRHGPDQAGPGQRPQQQDDLEQQLPEETPGTEQQ